MKVKLATSVISVLALLVPVNLTAANSTYKEVFFSVETYRAYTSGYSRDGQKCLTRTDYIENTCGDLQVIKTPRSTRRRK